MLLKINNQKLSLYIGIVLLLSFNFIKAQPPDTLTIKSPGMAAKYGLIFPGAGQFYNERYIKGTILTGLEIYAIIKFNEYKSDVKYDNITSAISKRNKSAWWMFFIYFYGILDAVVEAHLMPHKTVMDTPIE